MNQKLLRRAWNILWQHKTLLVLGLLVALGASHGGIGGVDLSLVGRLSPRPGDAAPVEDSSVGLLSALPQAAAPSPEGIAGLIQVLIGLMIGLACLLVIVAIGLGILSILARGGLIASLGAIARGEVPGLRFALRVGWQRLWPLMVIFSIPYIPVTLGAIIVVLLFNASFGGESVASLEKLGRPLFDPGFRTMAIGAMAPLTLISLALGFLQVFADRACVLEGRRPLEAYQRGWQVLRSSLRAALPLLLIELGLRLVVGFLVSLLTLTILLRCVLPLPLLIGTLLHTYRSTLWTLAWLEWTVK